MSDVSKLINRLLKGRRNEDFSARVGRRALTSKRWRILEVLINRFFKEDDHCWLAYLDELKK